MKSLASLHLKDSDGVVVVIPLTPKYFHIQDTLHENDVKFIPFLALNAYGFQIVNLLCLTVLVGRDGGNIFRFSSTTVAEVVSNSNFFGSPRKV